MTHNRPTVITVWAILNLVFGGLGLLCNTCGLLGAAFAMSMPGAGAQGAGGPNPMTGMGPALGNEIPGYTAYQFGDIAAGFILSALLVVSGIGLLGMRGWARWLCIITSVAITLHAVGTAAYTFAYVQPAMERLLTKELAKQPGAPPAEALNVFIKFVTIWAVLVGLVKIAYAVGLSVVMLLPGVSAAFAGRPIHREPDERYDDYEDDREDYDDRRRPDRDRADGEE